MYKYKGIDLVFEQLCDGLNEYKVKKAKEHTITLPEVFGIQRKENYISNWIAYFLNPNLNDFGLNILNALIQLKSQQSILDNEPTKKIKVFREYVFKNGKRIDILIKTPTHIIGIENKIDTFEHDEQTVYYWESMIEEGQNKIILGFYLHPDYSNDTPKCKHFYDLKYSELKQIIDTIDFSKASDDFQSMMLMCFSKYIGELLMAEKQFPGVDKLFRLYAAHRNEISEIQELYKKNIQSINNWIEDSFNAYTKKNGIQLIPIKMNKGYWQFVKDYKWRSIDFHFEVLWDDSLQFFEADKFDIQIHLEKNGTLSRYWNTEQLKKQFCNDTIRDSGINVLLAKNIIVNLNEEMSNESLQSRLIEVIENIIKLFESNEFISIAEKANQYIEEYESNSDVNESLVSSK